MRRKPGSALLGILGAVALAALAPATPVDAQWSFIRGDGNGDGSVNIADPIATLAHLFQSAPSPCPDAMDANDDGSLNIADAVFELDVLFGTSGTVPPAPYPTCGDDPTTNSLGCPGPLTGCPALPTGCTVNGECPPGDYCAKALGDCNGVGACTTPPNLCPVVFDPVCGCNGITYTNACFASQAGVNVETLGECVVAGCTTNGQCPPGQYCAKAIGDCSGTGSCATIPQFCPLIFDPVCGCDGQTYSNSCFAAGAGVNILHTGACP